MTRKPRHPLIGLHFRGTVGRGFVLKGSWNLLWVPSEYQEVVLRTMKKGFCTGQKRGSANPIGSPNLIGVLSGS